MKIAVTGKGGVGKTTFAAILSRLYAADGYKTLAVDADPDANLGLGLGLPLELIKGIIPISEMKDLVAERTNSKPGTYSTMFKINPKVDDIPDEYCVEYNGIRLLTMGTLDTGGGGCFCPENVLVKRLMSHIILENKDIAIMDMEAGLEHIGRGTAESVDAFFVVVEPGIRSIQTYYQVKKLADDIGVKHVYAVANKIKDDCDREFVQNYINDCLGFISYRDDIKTSDRYGTSPYESSQEAVEEVAEIRNRFFSMILPEKTE